MITDISVNPNNIDDTHILNERIDNLKEKTPELNEMHTDGGYGSQDNDKKFEELEINHITTAVRGRESEIEKKIERTSQSPDIYNVECPFQKVESTPTKKRHKVRFDMDTCSQCPLKDKCKIFKSKGRYYFTHEDYLQNRRNNNIVNIPEDRRKLRPNVEVLMNEFKTRTSGGKLKVRGLFKAALFAFNAGIAINFGRIFRYIAQNGFTGGFDLGNLLVFNNVLLIFVILWQVLMPFIDNFTSRLSYQKIFSDKRYFWQNVPGRQILN